MATHMLDSRGRSSALFRRFDRANLRALLDMEREIADLEAELELEESRGAVNEVVVERLGADLRRLMKEYCEFGPGVFDSLLVDRIFQETSS